VEGSEPWKPLAAFSSSFLSDLKTKRVGTYNREWHAEMVERESFIEDLMKRLGN
jgi:hypothetical protein